MAKRFFTLITVFLFSGFISMAGLKDIYLLRVKSDEFLEAKKFDSASFYLSKIVADTVLANATDYMRLSCCRLKLKDTPAFKKLLIYSIETGGADSSLIFSYFRALDTGDNIYLKTFLKAALPKYRAIFLSKVDPLIQREIDEIAFLDQVCRKQDDKAYPRDTVCLNSKCLRIMGAYADSVNYDRVVDLIRRKKYPGFHNFGIASANYDQILMHVSDRVEERWNFIYSFLLQQLSAGDIMQNQVVSIVTRHYRGKNCTFYGTPKWGLSIPCDCEKVDKFRGEIGLDSLKEEYRRLQLKLPDCYHE